MIHLSLSSRVIYHFISLSIPFSWNKVQTIYHHKIKPVNTKGTQPWIFIGRTDAEAPMLWPHDAKSWLIGNDHNAGKNWGQEEKGLTEDEMFGFHHWLNGHEFEYAPGVGDGQRSLECYGPWSHKELDMTEWLNWTELILPYFGLQRTMEKPDRE